MLLHICLTHILLFFLRVPSYSYATNQAANVLYKKRAYEEKPASGSGAETGTTGVITEAVSLGCFFYQSYLGPRYCSTIEIWTLRTLLQESKSRIDKTLNMHFDDHTWCGKFSSYYRRCLKHEPRKRCASKASADGRSPAHSQCCTPKRQGGNPHKNLRRTETSEYYFSFQICCCQAAIFQLNSHLWALQALRRSLWRP